MGMYDKNLWTDIFLPLGLTALGGWRQEEAERETRAANIARWNQTIYGGPGPEGQGYLPGYMQREDEVRDYMNRAYNREQRRIAALRRAGTARGEQLTDRIVGYARDLEGEGVEEARDRYGTVMTDVDRFGEGLVDRYGEQALASAVGYGNRTGEVLRTLDTLAANLQSGYGERYRRGLENLDGAGEQERQDIDTRWQAATSRDMADLVSRGLRSTTLAPSLAMGRERERSADVGRLEERLRQERQALDERLSGDMLLATERLGGLRAGYGAALRGDELAAAERMGDRVAQAYGNWGANRAAYGTGLSGDVLNTIAQLGGMRLGYERDMFSGEYQNWLNLQQMQNNVLSNQAANRINLYSQLPLARLQAMAARSDPMPSTNTLLQMANALSAGAGGTPQMAANSATPWITGGLGAAGALGSYFFHLLPYVEQDPLYKSALGSLTFPPPDGPTTVYYSGNNKVYS